MEPLFNNILITVAPLCSASIKRHVTRVHKRKVKMLNCVYAKERGNVNIQRRACIAPIPFSAGIDNIWRLDFVKE